MKMFLHLLPSLPLPRPRRSVLWLVSRYFLSFSYYFSKVKEEKKDSVAANETQKNGIVKEEKTVAEPLRVNTLPLSDAGAQDMQKLMDDCDLPASKLNEFDPAYKERIFYTLLMKGEKKMQSGIIVFFKFDFP